MGWSEGDGERIEGAGKEGPPSRRGSVDSLKLFGLICTSKSTGGEVGGTVCADVEGCSTSVVSEPIGVIAES